MNMRALVVYVCVLSALACARKTPKELWDEFRTTFSKSYSSAVEDEKRYQIFTSNMQEAEIQNGKNPYANFGMTRFSDLSKEEFKVYHNGEQYYNNVSNQNANQAKNVWQPSNVSTAFSGLIMNWVFLGAVTGVKDQGDCGSCWSFSTTGNIEGQNKLAGNFLVSLSEQELVSCDLTCNACDGGLPMNAFKYLLDNKHGNIVTELSYPYVSGSTFVPSCDMFLKFTGATIRSWISILSLEPVMLAFVGLHGPLSVGVYAGMWNSYNGGVLTDCGIGKVDHAVLIVGYNTHSSPSFWIIKNSWAVSWGELGYIRIGYGTDMCSVSSMPTSSIV